MAFGFYLNMERVAIDIIENSISQMSDDNVLTYGDEGCEDEINEKELIKNLYHGSTALVFISTLYETALNTIISKRLNCLDDDILRASTSIKLHMICFEYEIDYAGIKGDNRYSIISEMQKARNDIILFKYNYLNEGSFIPSDVKIPMGTSKKNIADIFTKQKMKNYYDGTLTFLKFLCDKSGFILNKDCHILDCDAKDDQYEFICAKEGK